MDRPGGGARPGQGEMRLEEVLPVKAVAGHPAPLEASQSELKA